MVGLTGNRQEGTPPDITFVDGIPHPFRNLAEQVWNNTYRINELKKRYPLIDINILDGKVLTFFENSKRFLSINVVRDYVTKLIDGIKEWFTSFEPDARLQAVVDFFTNLPSYAAQIFNKAMDIIKDIANWFNNTIQLIRDRVDAFLAWVTAGMISWPNRIVTGKPDSHSTENIYFTNRNIVDVWGPDTSDNKGLINVVNLSDYVINGNEGVDIDTSNLPNGVAMNSNLSTNDTMYNNAFRNYYTRQRKGYGTNAPEIFPTLRSTEEQYNVVLGPDELEAVPDDDSYVPWETRPTETELWEAV